MRLPLVMLGLLVLITPASYAGDVTSFLVGLRSTPTHLRQARVDVFWKTHPRLPLAENDSTVYILYRGHPSTVSMAGDMTGWRPGIENLSLVEGTDLWYLPLRYPTDARLDYKLVIDSKDWILDPRNPLTSAGGFGTNSELRMPRYPPAPELDAVPGIPHGTLRDTVFTSATLGNNRTVSIYLPPGYERDTVRYPVAVFHDGQDYRTLGAVPSVLDLLIARKRIRPLIAVFIPPVNRVSEYAGPHMTVFTSFVADTILRAIDSRYRTIPLPATRAVIGASDGGNISLWNGWSRPDVFGNVAAYSSNATGNILSGFHDSPRRPIKLYLDMGKYDIPILIPRVKSLLSILATRGYVYRYQEFAEGHSWGSWRAHIDDALEFFFPAVGDRQRPPSAPRGGLRLYPCRPNPATTSTTINFALGSPGPVSALVTDTTGLVQAIPVRQTFRAGVHSITWKCELLKPGSYMVRLTTGRMTATEPLTVSRSHSREGARRADP